MADQFIILEPLGNGYRIVDTGDRPDSRETLKTFFEHGDIPTQDGMMILPTTWNAEDIEALSATARLVIPNTSGGPNGPSAMGRVHGIELAVVNDVWVVIVDYTGANPLTDTMIVNAVGQKSSQVSRSNITNN